MTYAFLSFMDRSVERSTFSFNLAELAADGSNYAALTAAVDAVQAACEGVTLGNIQERSIIAERSRLTNVIPTTGRRETKFLVRYQDDVTLKVFTLEIPNADDVPSSSIVYATGTDFVDLNASSPPAVQTALLSALNTYVKSPLGNDITVISIEVVGRNT